MKSLILIASLALSTFASDVRVPMLDGRIVGGVEVDIADYGWQVSLQRNGGHSCGGSIVNNFWIVTAAHCVSPNEKGRIVRVGSSEHGRRGATHEVVEIIVHPEYDKASSWDCDVALLRVREPFRINGRTIRPVKLPEPGLEIRLTPGSMLTVTGWGTLIQGGTIPSTLQMITIPVIERKLCQQLYEKNGNITENMICAGHIEGGKDSCQGDSGGPVVDESGILVGIVSWGKGCAQPNFPGVYTNVPKPKVREFIRKHTRL